MSTIVPADRGDGGTTNILLRIPPECQDMIIRQLSPQERQNVSILHPQLFEAVSRTTHRTLSLSGSRLSLERRLSELSECAKILNALKHFSINIRDADEMRSFADMTGRFCLDPIGSKLYKATAKIFNGTRLSSLKVSIDEDPEVEDILTKVIKRLQSEDIVDRVGDNSFPFEYLGTFRLSCDFESVGRQLLSTALEKMPNLHTLQIWQLRLDPDSPTDREGATRPIVNLLVRADIHLKTLLLGDENSEFTMNDIDVVLERTASVKELMLVGTLRVAGASAVGAESVRQRILDRFVEKGQRLQKLGIPSRLISDRYERVSDHHINTRFATAYLDRMLNLNTVHLYGHGKSFWHGKKMTDTDGVITTDVVWERLSKDWHEWPCQKEAMRW